MKKIFSLVLGLTAMTTMSFAAVQQAQETVDCGTSKTIVATPATGYQFVRWEKDGSPIDGGATLTISDISADATYEAIFAINTYTIRFLNGTDVLQTSTVEHGQLPTYNGATPTQASTAQYTYAFNGWSSTVVTATADQDYVAQFTPTLRSYTITFKNGEEVLQTGSVAYGETPVYNGATPTKAATAQYTYTFADWDAEVVAVTGEKTYNATFTPNLRSYTITFKNGDEVLQTGSVAYGETPVYNGATPTKPSDAGNDYEFAGWDMAIASVTGEATYTATFTTVPKTFYTITEGVTPTGTGYITGVGSYENGTVVTLTAVSTDDCYVFDHWADDLSTDPSREVTITGDVTYTAVFRALKYTLKVESEDDTMGTVTIE